VIHGNPDGGANASGDQGDGQPGGEQAGVSPSWWGGRAARPTRTSLSG
jgi:hypothetical protein